MKCPLVKRGHLAQTFGYVQYERENGKRGKTLHSGWLLVRQFASLQNLNNSWINESITLQSHEKAAPLTWLFCNKEKTQVYIKVKNNC